jgi:hypothetical protein
MQTMFPKSGAQKGTLEKDLMSDTDTLWTESSSRWQDAAEHSVQKKH